MASASLNISVTEKRMMNDTEAASYCGLPTKHFKAVCPVQPVKLGGKDLRYDKRDLDAWIDREKSGEAARAMPESWCSASTSLSGRDNHLGRFMADGVGVG